MPAPPPGFYPGRSQTSVQDIPHLNVQAAQRVQGPVIAAKPTPNPVLSAAKTEAATVSAEPELRDFKKEATSFVPTALKRKRPGVASSKVNAAPSFDTGGNTEAQTTEEQGRPDLLDTLKNQFPSAQQESSISKKQKVAGVRKAPDDYAKFKEGMSDLLGK